VFANRALAIRRYRAAAPGEVSELGGVAMSAGLATVQTGAGRPSPRVYWLTEEFYPPQVGGAELMAFYLSSGLADAGFPVDVITRQPDLPAATDEIVGRVRVRRIPPRGLLKGIGWRAAPGIVAYWLRLARILFAERNRYDLVVISGMKIIPIVAVPLCALMGKRCVVRVESSFEIREPVSAASLTGTGGLLRRATANLLGRLQRLMLRLSDRVVVISEEILQLLRQGKGKISLARIPNAVDLERFRPVSLSERDELRARLHLPSDRTLIVFAGRLSRAKGIEMLVRALPDLLSRHPHLYLVVVGGGGGSFDDCEQDLRDFVKQHRLEGAVHFAGMSSKVEEFLQAGDVFVFPSDYEGFSLGLVEALGSAIPCVVTAVGAAPQLIKHGETGFLFPPKDSTAMVAALEECLSRRDDWSAIGGRAREAVAPYDLRAVVSAYVRLCNEVADARAEPPGPP
jgi:glycosyltransferase involved in cell wall biosynthesis